jgi:hypothetical protein
MTEKPKKFKTKLTVKSQEPIGEFERNNVKTTIYKVEAVTAEGKPVDKKLRTFHEELPVGVLEEYDVEPYEHKDFGMTYTLKIPTKGRASKKDIAEMKKQLSDQGGRIAALEEEVAELRALVMRERPLEEHLAEVEKAPWDQ